MWAYKGSCYGITNPVECQPCVSFINRNHLAGNVNDCLSRKCLTGLSVEKVFEEFEKVWNSK